MKKDPQKFNNLRNYLSTAIMASNINIKPRFRGPFNVKLIFIVREKLKLEKTTSEA